MAANVVPVANVSPPTAAAAGVGGGEVEAAEEAEVGGLDIDVPRGLAAILPRRLARH